MTVAQALPHMAADMLCCLGLGFLLAAVYDLIRFLLGDSRPVCFLADLAAFALAAVLLTGFAAGRSRAGAVRWYMAAALLLGHAGYFGVLAPATRAVEEALRWLFGRPFVLVWLLLQAPLTGLKREVSRFWAKRRKKAKIKHAKQLQKNAKVLYNSK